MSEYTLSYSDSSKGWPSFYSFMPDYMIGMNQRFYSFKGGNLFRHNDGQFRNRFYGQDFSSKIKGVFNQSPLENKVFKTIALESTDQWDFSCFTELENGLIEFSDFEKKEDTFFAYIREGGNDPLEESDLKLRSAQGLGVAQSIEVIGNNTIISYPFRPDTIISTGDLLYRLTNTGDTIYIGKIISVDRGLNTITIDEIIVPGGIQDPVDSFTLYAKNSVAESNGVRGSYLVYEIENSNTSAIELFAVKSNIFKSYP